MPLNQERVLKLADDTLRIEAQELEALRRRLQEEDAEHFAASVSLLLSCKGRVVISGIGKSGHIARKIAATMASTGTPAMFVHPAEAMHGDLGMITKDDVFIGISYSGEATEILAIAPIIKRMGTRFIAMTGNPASNMAKVADIHLNLHVAREACPLNLAPTASTTVTIALGDALAVATLDAKGFHEEDFARSHPGGALGRRLLTHVSDVMRKGDDVPVVQTGTKLFDALFEITKKGMAMTAVVDADGKAVGVFTDGDLRRLIEKQWDLKSLIIDEVMTRNPRTIAPERMAVEAVSIMEQYRINQVLVTDSEGRLTGALHIHDLTVAKVI